jgi:hypothetical protein
VKGTLEVFSLEEILQPLCKARKFGMIDVKGAHGQYGIYLEGENIYHAFSPHFDSGINALFEAFIETEGEFEFKELFNSEKVSINKPLFEILLEGAEIKSELAEVNRIIRDDTIFEPQLIENEIVLSADEFKFLSLITREKAIDVMKKLNIDYIIYLKRLKPLLEKGLVRAK